MGCTLEELAEVEKYKKEIYDDYGSMIDLKCCTMLSLFFLKRLQDELVFNLMKTQEFNMKDTDSDGKSYLAYAVKYNYGTNMINFLIDKGVKVNTIDMKGNTPLIYAVKHNTNLDVLEILLKNRGNVNHANHKLRNALMYASKYKRQDLIPTLLKYGASVAQTETFNDNLLMYLIRSDYPVDMISKCMATRTYVNDQPCVIHVVKQILKFTQNIDVLKLFLNRTTINVMDEQYRTSLMFALTIGYPGSPKTVEIIKFMLDLGADTNICDKFGSTALKLAMKYNHHEDIILLLINYGANVNQSSIGNGSFGLSPIMCAMKSCVNSQGDISPSSDYISVLMRNGADLNHRDRFGRTPLMYVVSEFAGKNCAHVVFEKFMRNGADINCKDVFGKSVLFHAVRKRNSTLKLVKMIVDHGDDINAYDNSGNTVLHHVVNVEIFDFLYSICRTPIDVTNNEGSTPLHFACIYKKDKELVKYLLENGADPNFGMNRNVTLCNYSYTQIIDRLQINISHIYFTSLLQFVTDDELTAVLFLYNIDFSPARYGSLNIKRVSIMKNLVLHNTEFFNSAVRNGTWPKALFYQQELVKMKRTFITDTDISYYEFCKCKTFATRQFSNVTVDNFFESKRLACRFPNYCDIIRFQITSLGKEVARRKLLRHLCKVTVYNRYEGNGVTTRANYYRNVFTLNNDCLLQVASFLTTKEIYKLIKASMLSS